MYVTRVWGAGLFGIRHSSGVAFQSAKNSDLASSCDSLHRLPVRPHLHRVFDSKAHHPGEDTPAAFPPPTLIHLAEGDKLWCKMLQTDNHEQSYHNLACKFQANSKITTFFTKYGREEVVHNDHNDREEVHKAGITYHSR
jgi:hypothetical protein